jgi:hypothetical protein
MSGVSGAGGVSKAGANAPAFSTHGWPRAQNAVDSLAIWPACSGGHKIELWRIARLIQRESGVRERQPLSAFGV